jgi:hypothetical protein
VNNSTDLDAIMEEENAFDTLCRNEGAEDSEDGLDDDILNEDTMDRAAFEHENLAATLDDEITEGGGQVANQRHCLYGCPDDWTPPVAPTGWVPDQRKDEYGEPEWEDVDNPGKWWSQFTFRPKFKGRGEKTEYMHHALPTNRSHSIQF